MSLFINNGGWISHMLWLNVEVSVIGDAARQSTDSKVVVVNSTFEHAGVLGCEWVDNGLASQA